MFKEDMFNSSDTSRALFKISSILLMTLVASLQAFAQQSTFTYQGRLTDGGNPANGVYDMRFELFPDLINGLPLSEPIIDPTVEVTNGVFTVSLGFGEDFFDGSPRFLEISIRPAGSSDPYTELSPRQPIQAAPYALRSLTAATADTATNSNQLGGIAATGFIQNGASQQASTNFNISGNGTAAGTLSGNTINAATQYNINGSRALSVAGTNNLFVGLGTGAANTTGSSNTFVGAFAGNDNTTSGNNSFFGAGAGRDNITGASNSFFGAFAGDVNTTGSNNAFFGPGAGGANTTANNNSFFGAFAGFTNATGASNSFFGAFTGDAATGSRNSFFGADAGGAATATSDNSFFGAGAGSANTVGGSNSFFGASVGSATTTGGFNSLFGVGAGEDNTTGNSNAFFGRNAGTGNTTGSNNTAIGTDAEMTTGNLSFATAIGAGAAVSTSNTIALGRVTDTVRVPGDLNVFGSISLMQLGSPGPTPLCYNGVTDEIASCSSSLRYKDRLAPFTVGLELINRLRPITFNWKQSGQRDLGLGAEDVAKVEPLLVTYNQQGRVEGVKYDRISVVLINAIKQQQDQIRRQESQIDALKKVICLDHPNADVCR